MTAIFKGDRTSIAPESLTQHTRYVYKDAVNTDSVSGIITQESE